jgi:opacity protein-like surface antigen
MSRSRARLLHASALVIAAACGLCALDAQAQFSGPPSGKALIVIYRSDRQPVAGRVPVIANADRLGELGNREYVRAFVNPGRTFLRAGDQALSTLTLQTAPNQTYYVMLAAVTGATPLRVDMRAVSEVDARSALAQSRPAGPAAALPPSRPPVAAPLAAAPAAAARAPAPVPAPPPRAPVAAAPPPVPQRMAPREPAPPATEEEEEAERHKWRFAVIAKTGSFKLGTTSQSLGGLQSMYDKSSKPVAGLEGEMRHQDGFAVGAEVFYYKNDLTVPGTTLQATQTVVSGMLNGKYYFGVSDWFYPFVGAGVGFAGATFAGDLQGKSSGPVFQGLAGADIRFGDFGLYLEYKYLSASTQDSANQKIKVGGSGILAGVSVAF